MKIFNGKKEAEKILKKLKKQIKEKKLKPKLVVFLVGKNKASEVYVSLKQKAAEKIGVNFVLKRYSVSVSEKELVSEIKKANKDRQVSGIIVQLPLPKKFNPDKIISKIDPKKDADGFCKENVSGVLVGKNFSDPVLPKVIFYTAKKALGEKLKNKKIVALVNSKVFALGLKNFFEANKINIFTVVCKGLSKNSIKKHTKEADVLISVLGRPNFITADMLKQNVVLIDAGIAKAKGKIYGDVCFSSIKQKASFITPVPGGIGPLTVAFLMENVVFSS